ncbi:MAG: hypothetical protein V1789_10435 [PVC group bacterium]
MSAATKKIFCPHCRQESAVRVVKKYDGFTPVGEVKTCAFCGREFGEEEPASIEERAPGWTRDGELKKVCRRCRHYVINPFIQKCILRQKEVEATDTCADFRLRPSPPPESKKKEEKPPSLLGPPPAPPDIF